jgi:ribosomal protein S18 acetylase RimI-like enzyme
MRKQERTPDNGPQTPSIHLRSFETSDLETLYQIDQACFPPGVSYSRHELAGFISHRNSQTWVAQAGDDIVGFLVASRDRQRVSHIVTIDVVERWRRHRVGTTLMDAAEEEAQRQNSALIYLETAEDNFAAQVFYQKRGYVRWKLLQRYYGNGTSAWTMVKWLLKGEG